MLAAGPGRGDLQAHLAVARVAEQPPALTPASLLQGTSWESAPTTSAGACSSRRSRDTPDRSGATAFSWKQPRFQCGRRRRWLPLSDRSSDAARASGGDVSRRSLLLFVRRARHDRLGDEGITCVGSTARALGHESSHAGVAAA